MSKYWSAFSSTAKIFPLGWKIADFLDERGGEKPIWQKTPFGWKHTSQRVKRIFYVKKLPQYHSRVFKLLKQKRR